MAIGTTAAIIGSAAIGAGSSRAAANSQSKAINNAAASEAAAARENIAATERERARNEKLFQPYIGAGDRAQGYLDALLYGNGSYGGASGLPADYGVDPGDIEQVLREQNPDMAAYWDRWESAGAKPGGHRDKFGDFSGYVQAERPTAIARAEQTVGQSAGGQAGGAGNPATTVTRDEVMGLIDSSPLSTYARDDYARRGGLIDQEYGDISNVTEGNYGNARKLAQDNLKSRLDLEGKSYAAWLPISEKAEQDAINLTYSRGGVTGLVGQTRRGVGETTQAAGMERNLRKLEGDQAAHTPYYADVTNAENTRGAARTYNTTNRAGRRSSAYDTFAGDRLNSYADFTGNLQGRADQGYGARGQVASYGQQAVSNNNQQRTSGARAASDAAYARGAVQQQLYGDVARVAGDAYGAITNKNDPKKTRGYM